MNPSLWKALGSVRVTVVCLAISVILIFIGTIAQVDEGLYQAQARYFKQWVVWQPLVFGYRLPVPFPGGYLLGTVLALNLIVAHTQRFTWSRRKWGIHATHLGILVLLVGQLATDMLSDETHLRLREGESQSFTEEHRRHELVFRRAAAGGEGPEVVSFPEKLVARKKLLTDEKLPFALRVKEYGVNSEIFSRAAVLEAGGQVASGLATVEAGLATVDGLIAQARAAEESGGRREIWRAALRAIQKSDTENLAAIVEDLDHDERERLRQELRRRFRDEMLAAFKLQSGPAKLAAERIEDGEPVGEQTLPLKGDRGYALQAYVVSLPETRELNDVNLPYASIELEQEGESLGTWLFSPWLAPQEIAIGDTRWRAAFRPGRVYHPFEVKLLETTHEVYLGTDIPKNFQSRIRIHHPGKGETREVDISMNHPLRYEGLTFYQYQMGRDELSDNLGTSTLLVVRNPTWLAPYFGCVLVALGMSYHFLLHLLAFLNRRGTVMKGASAQLRSR